MITVGELRKLLDGQPDDKPVVLSKDIEGNGYSPLAYVEDALYEATSTYSGEIYFPEDGEEDEDYHNVERVVVLFPVN